ncbi:unnamed protein product [Brugia timori]|uniref:SPT6_acidic domain-containing protein n=1 Tax=Brugia timori TaxID=42155 RepID=A0A0R3QAF6_9BILA|nr:unnamed protein product [Brugia timori]
MKMRMKKEGEEETIYDDDIQSVNSDEFNMLLDRFEPGERREVFDVDFSQEFSIEKKKEMKNRKRPLENETDDEEDDVEKKNMIDADEDEELEEDIEDESSVVDEEEEGSIEDEFVKPTKETYDSDDSDDFVQQFNYVEDAAISADKVSFLFL